MKKPWILILTALVLATLIGMWLYLFFGGEEAREDIYNAFGLEGKELPFNMDVLLGEPSASSAPPYLRQLSLRQVAGYVPLDSSSTSPRTVRLAEKGTGHIYSVRVDDGAEERLSNITIPAARDAFFSPDGSYAAITTSSNQLTLITLPAASTTLSSKEITASPTNVSFSSNNELLYSVREGQSVVGYSYDTTTSDTSRLFTIPFREAVVLWGSDASGPHYTYPKTAEGLEGYLYEIKNSSLRRLPISGFGLSAIVHDDTIAFSRTEEATYKSYLFNLETSTITPVQFLFIPEKCLIVLDKVSCATDVPTLKSDSVGAWYRGELSFNDTLWLDPPGIDITMEIDTLGTKTGRPIDATRLNGQVYALYFVNKIDAGLWVYDRDFTTGVIDN